MSLSAFVNLFFRTIFLLLTLLALRDLVHHRDRARLGIAAMFAVLAIAVLAGRIPAQSEEAARVIQVIVSLALVSHPYLLLRLVETFHPISRTVHWFTVAGLVASWLVLLLGPVPPRPLSFLLIMAYFLYAEGYAAVAMLNSARQTAGVTRWRLTLIGAASILLAAAIVALRLRAAVSPVAALGQLLFTLLSVAAAISYYLGFATPRWLQRAWQLTELHRFLGQATGRSTDMTAEETFVLLSRAATRAVGAITAVTLIGDKTDTELEIVASDGAPLELDRILLEEGAAFRVRQTQQPGLASNSANFGIAQAAAINAATGARSMLAVPIVTAVHPPGLLAAFLYGTPLFAKDDLALLALFAERTAIMLDNIALLGEQQHLVERLEVANRDLESFAYSVSHDLRAPLRAIDGYSQALLEDCGDQIDELGQDYLVRIRANTQRMGELIDALLLLSRLSLTEMHIEAVDLSAMASNIAAELARRDNERAVEFVIAPGLRADGDTRLLRVVLENLLDNAWKFTTKRRKARIEFGAVQENGQHVFFVRDDGVGFDMAYADKLFGVFQRLHAMDDFSGTGVGLATVQRVVQRHRGRVWAQAAPEEGAAFFFTLAVEGGDDGKPHDLVG